MPSRIRHHGSDEGRSCGLETGTLAGGDGRREEVQRLPNWLEVERKRAYERFGRAVDEVVFRLPSGKVETFSLKSERSTVSVFAITADDEIVLTRQFRPGPRRVLHELPGGYVTDSESVVQAGSRELMEETGFGGQATVVGSCYADAYSDALKYCVVVCDALKNSNSSLDAEEFVTVSLVSLAELRAIMRSGYAADLDMVYMALDHLRLI